MHEDTTGFSRRELLRAAGAASAGAGLAPLLAACGQDPTQAESGVWKNWSGSVRAEPSLFARPESEGALRRLLRDAGSGVRPVGAGHSFTPVAASDDVMVSLERMRGLIDIQIDGDRRVAILRAGTSIRDAAALLHESGHGFPNQGDVDPQAVAGAIGTATHGTGIALPSFSGMLQSARLVTSDGEVVDIDGGDRELLNAARTAMGTLGVLSEVGIAVQRRYKLREREYTRPLKDVLAEAETMRDAHRHFEFFGFFGSDTAIVKTLDPTDDDITPPPMLELPVNTALRLASEWVLQFPGSAEPVQRLLTTLAGSTERIDWSHRIFPSPRNVQFNEMEYSVPAERGIDCIQAVLDKVRRSGQPVLFPFEFRYIAAEDAWLSPFHERPGAAISIHRYYKADPKPLFSLVEPILRDFGGRPHWGKMHTMQHDELAALYPRWSDFQRIRRRLDPDGRMLTPYLRTLFHSTA